MCEYHSLASPLSADSLPGFTGTKTKHLENDTGSDRLFSPICIAEFSSHNRLSLSINMTRQALLESEDLRDLSLMG